MRTAITPSDFDPVRPVRPFREPDRGLVHKKFHQNQTDDIPNDTPTQQTTQARTRNKTPRTKGTTQRLDMLDSFLTTSSNECSTNTGRGSQRALLLNSLHNSSISTSSKAGCPLTFSQALIISIWFGFFTSLGKSTRSAAILACAGTTSFVGLGGEPALWCTP